MQFGLKTTFLAISLFSVFFVVGMKAGVLVAIGVGLAIAALLWTLRFRKRGYFIIPRTAVAILSLGTIWFLAVDWSWHIFECPQCLTTRDLAEYRVLGFVVQSDVIVERSIFSRAFEDLGLPCAHSTWEDFYKHRWWGLVVCACPCWNGTMGFMSEDDRYTDEVAERVREVGERRPEFAWEVVNRMSNNRDVRFFWDALMTDVFVEQLLGQPTTNEASNWLSEGAENEIRRIGNHSTENSRDVVQEIYDAGGREVLIAEPEKESWVKIGESDFIPVTPVIEEAIRRSRQVNPQRRIIHREIVTCNKIIVRLPEESTDRKRLMNMIDSKYVELLFRPTRDGGQKFLEIWIE